MGRIKESLSLFHQILRTLLLLIVLGAVGGAGYLGYRAYRQRQETLDQAQAELSQLQETLQQREQELDQKRRQVESLTRDVAELKVTIAEQKQQIEKLDLALRLLKVRRRVAQLRVIDQIPDEEKGTVVSRVEFVELDDQGKPIGEPRRFSVTGDTIYVDSWVVKFEDRFIESAAIDRSTSLVLFRRLFSDKQKPEEGFSLDPVGSRPAAYGDARTPSELEKKIWADFWTIATDEKKAKELGIRAAHGEAPSVPLKKGMVYRIELRAADGLSIRPEPSEEATDRS